MITHLKKKTELEKTELEKSELETNTLAEADHLKLQV